MPKQVAIFGYSGHAYVACEILYAMERSILGYYELERKAKNPYKLPYLGSDESINNRRLPAFTDYFVAIGNNKLRERISAKIEKIWGKPISLVHPSAWVSKSVVYSPGCMVAPNANVSAQVRLGKGVICNTGSVIEHESIIGDFVHIAPGATLCGNVKVGAGSLIGANAVIKPGITIGKQVTIGAGAVIVKAVPDHAVIVGNPQHSL